MLGVIHIHILISLTEEMMTAASYLCMCHLRWVGGTEIVELENRKVLTLSHYALDISSNPWEDLVWWKYVIQTICGIFWLNKCFVRHIFLTGAQPVIHLLRKSHGLRFAQCAPLHRLISGIIFRKNFRLHSTM